MTSDTQAPDKTSMFQFRVDPQFTDRLREIVRAEKDLPTKAEMLRRLVDRAYEQVKR